LPTDGSKIATVDMLVSNLGPYRGDIVVLVFLVPKHLPTQKDSKLRQKLVDFSRAADVPVGSRQTISFSITAEKLALADLSTGSLVTAPGDYDLRFERGTPDDHCNVALQLTGPQHIVEPFPSSAR
jgi:hypothetical protein